MATVKTSRYTYTSFEVIRGSATEARLLQQMADEGWEIYETVTQQDMSETSADGDYTENRYGKWRNFDSSEIIHKINYTSSQICYYYVDENGIPYEDENGWYGCFYNNTKIQPASYSDGIADSRNTWKKIQKIKTLQECKEILTQAYNERYIEKTLHTSGRGHGYTQKVWTDVDGVKYYIGEHYDYEKFNTYSLENFLNEYLVSYYNNQWVRFAKEHQNFVYTDDLPATTTAAREIELNAGLIADGVTSKDSNPTWSGVNCFTFGEWSCGKAGYNKGDPSLQNISAMENPDDCKDEMHFEVTAELTQEDILDIINRNPMSLQAGSTFEDDNGNQIVNDNLMGLTDSLIDGVQVRVIRLTPCYLSHTDASNNLSYSYSDVVKWSYLKTYCIDKQKLIDDIDTTKKGNYFAKINCDVDTFESDYKYLYDENGTVIDTLDVNARMAEEGSVRWNQWNIDDYKQKTVSDDDQKKLTTLAVKVYPDKLGYISNSLDKINVVAHAVTPALKYSWVRYWYKDNNTYYRYDSYDDDITQSFTIPDFEITRDEWYEDTPEDESALISITGKTNYYYEVRSNPWDKKIVPAKVEKAFTIQQIMNPDGTVYQNADGNPEFETIKYGNSWTDFIRREMSKNKDSAGRWIASNSFLNTFTEQNALLQAVGFLVGQSFGKDSYGYNTLSDDRFIRLWYKNEDESIGTEGYYYYNSDEVSLEDIELPEFSLEDREETHYIIGDLWKLKKETFTIPILNITFYKYTETQSQAEYDSLISDGWIEVEHTEVSSPYTCYPEKRWYYAGNDFFLEQNPTQIENTDYYWSFRKVESDINPLALLESAEYTDSIDIGSENGGYPYKCNWYMYNQQKAETALSTILIAARAFWVYDELGRYEFHNDKPLYNPVLLITDENSISSQNTRSFDKTIAGYHVTFQDEENNFQNGELYCLRDGQTKEKHTKDIKDLSLQGVTNAKQAWDIACYMLGCTITQREIWTRKLNHVGNALSVGSLVEIQGNSLRIGSDYSGRILQVIEGVENGKAYIYGFVIDGMYEYKGKYIDQDYVDNTLDDDGSQKYTNADIGRNIQGITLMQPDKTGISRTVTLRMATLTQQTNGIPVTNIIHTPTGDREETIIYKNLLGNTNLVLFEKKIIKDKKRLEDQDSLIEDEDLNVTSTTVYLPKQGDIVAFGDVGVITSKAVVFSITPDENGNFSVSCYPYYDSLYTSGAALPVYNANMTKKAIVDNVYTNDALIETTLNITDSKNAVNAVISAITDGDEDSGVSEPDNITNLSSKALRDSINITWSPLPNAGLRNSLSCYVIQMSKNYTAENIENDEVTWVALDGSDGVSTVESNEAQYVFNRSTDGYPEASVFNSWRFRVKARNAYGKESEEWTLCNVITDSYGTWLVNVPNIDANIDSRRAILSFSPNSPQNTTVYGTIRYRVRIKRGALTWVNENTQTVSVAADSNWYEPNMSSNPYSDRESYRGTQDGYKDVSDTFVYILPLYGLYENGATGRLYTDTPYLFDIQAYNEIHSSEWLSVNGSPVRLMATVTALRDVVAANPNTQKEFFVESLSAISANLGDISDGTLTGDNHNYWTLSTKPNAVESDNNRDFKGAFRVGDDKQYFLVKPVVRQGQVDGYQIEMKVANLSFTNVDGEDTTTFEKGTYVYNDTRTARLKITEAGIEIQTLDANEIPTTVGKVKLDSNGNLFISNELEENLPSFISPVSANNYVGYHFEGTGADVTKDTEGSNTLDCTFTGTKSETDGILIESSSVFVNDLEQVVSVPLNTMKSGGRTKLVFLTKAEYIHFLRDMIHLTDSTKDVSDVVEPSDLNTIAEQDGLNWGLTQAQINSGIFKKEIM